VLEGASPGEHLSAGEVGAEVADTERASSAAAPCRKKLPNRDEDVPSRDPLRGARLRVNRTSHVPHPTGTDSVAPIPEVCDGARSDDARRTGFYPGSARTPIVEARGTVLTGWEGDLRIGVTRHPFLRPRLSGSRQT